MFSVGCFKINTGKDISPVFIVGAGRSGNTLLRKILCGSRDLYIPPETYVLGSCVADFERYSFLGWPTVCRIVLSRFAFSPDFDTFPNPLLGGLYQKLCSAPEQEKSCAHIIDSFYKYMAETAKPSAVRWGDKTPHNVFHLESIDSVFPKAQYIHIIRNGYDVVASYMKMGRYDDPADAAERWATAIRKCRDFGRDRVSRYTEVRYETLVAAPYEVTASLCDFLGLRYSPDILDKPPAPEELGDVDRREHYGSVMKPITGDSIGKGRKSLKDEEIARIEPIIAPLMKDLGYV